MRVGNKAALLLFFMFLAISFVVLQAQVPDTHNLVGIQREVPSPTGGAYGYVIKYDTVTGRYRLAPDSLASGSSADTLVIGAIELLGDTLFINDPSYGGHIIDMVHDTLYINVATDIYGGLDIYSASDSVWLPFRIFRSGNRRAYIDTSGVGYFSQLRLRGNSVTDDTLWVAQSSLGLYLASLDSNGVFNVLDINIGGITDWIDSTRMKDVSFAGRALANPFRYTHDSYWSGKMVVGSQITGDGTLHVHTGSAGTVTADANADEGVFENSGDSGISILTPNANSSRIYFGSPTSNLGAYITWCYDASQLTLGSVKSGASVVFVSGAGAEAMRIDGSQHVIVGKTTGNNTLGIRGIANNDSVFAVYQHTNGAPIADLDSLGNLHITGVIKADGNLWDTTHHITVGSGQDYETIQEALNSLNQVVFEDSILVYLDLTAETHSISSSITFTHPQGTQVWLSGAEPDTTTITGGWSASGSAGAWSVTFKVSDADNATTDMYALITDVWGDSLSASIVGCFPITAVDTVNDSITISSAHTGAAFPVGIPTAGTCKLLSSVISSSTAYAFNLTRSAINLNDVAIDCGGNSMALLLWFGSVVKLSNVGIYNVGTGISLNDVSVVALESGVALGINKSTSGVTVASNSVFRVGGGSVGISGTTTGFSNIRGGSLNVNSKQCVVAGAGTGYNTDGAAGCYITSTVAGGLQALHCTTVGFYCKQAYAVYQNSATYSTNTVDYKAEMGGIVYIPSYKASNSTDMTPALDTEGTNLEKIVD